MQQTAQEKSDDAFDKVIGWLEHFEDLEDPRQNGRVLYPLNEVLLLVLLAVIAGAEGWTEAALYGRQKLEFLRRFARSRTAHRHTTVSARSLRPSTPSSFNAASSPGSAT